MSAQITFSGQGAVSTRVLSMDDGSRFIVLYLQDRDVSLILDGRDAKAAWSAHAIIDALQSAIATIEAAPAPTPALTMTYADGAA